MAKPIFLCVFPRLSAEAGVVLRKALVEQLDDYHVVVFSLDVPEPTFQVLNAEYMEPLQFIELQEQVKEIVLNKVI